MVMALSNSISHGPARTMIGSLGNALEVDRDLRRLLRGR
ncbi:Unknown protein sequence [Pseudomonas syringae pv. syringae]|nr:Unknown protein sequence [Pseudomonas syringae pv. syringae]